MRGSIPLEPHVADSGTTDRKGSHSSSGLRQIGSALGDDLTPAPSETKRRET